MIGFMHRKRNLLRLGELEEKLVVWVEKKGYRHPDATIGESARRIGVDPHLLQRYFLDVKGVDFRSWRTRLRIEDARKELLEHPHLPVSEVGYRVGFSDRSNFIHQFTRLTGQTPRAYREKRLAPDIKG